MVLLAISGYTVLLIFGLYAPIMNEIKEVHKFKYLLAIFIFAIGVVGGILITVRYLLKTYRSKII